MAKMTWDDTGKRLYETGVSNGVIYPQETGGTYPKGAPWNGLTAINESPSGAEATALHADNIKYLSLMSAEDFNFTIEAYTYPDEFKACNGEAELAKGVYVTQQKRKSFGLCYKTILGNDTENNAHGYKLHLVYGAQAAPSEMSRNTVNESPEAITMSWECNTTPVSVAGLEPTAHLIIDSTAIDETKLKKIEDALYGGEGEAHLLLPDEVLAIINAT